MSLTIIRGNLFTSTAQTLVNTVNCVGVMGAGVAFEFRLRYPDMFLRYVDLCKAHQITVGSLWLFKAPGGHWVLNFPTKTNWKLPSRIEYLDAGLRKFVNTYAERGITSVAFPVLGAGKGGIPESRSLELMQRHLAECPIDIQIYRYDAAASDDLYREFQSRFANLSDREITDATGIRLREIDALRKASAQSEYRTLSQLLAAPGVGEVTLERCFKFVNGCGESSTSGQLGLGV